jgi:transcriptional regulator of NAD metabolism
MNNKHDEIKKLLKASRTMLTGERLTEDIQQIRSQYKLITEQGVDLTDDNITKKYDVAQSVEDKIEDDVESQSDKKQAYRISGGILVLHGKDKTDIDLTTDDKAAFQETMDEFVEEVSDLVDFNKLNVYPNNVEWSGKLIEFDLEFFFSIGEENGTYINGEMIKTDDEFLELINKLKAYYEKFKSKWSKILASRKKTSDDE